MIHQRHGTTRRIPVNEFRLLFTKPKSAALEKRVVALTAATYDSASVKEFYDSFDTVLLIGVVLLLLAASMAIWKWGSRYKSSMARTAAVLMIAGIWVGVGVRGGLILALAGLILMVAARLRFLKSQQKQTVPDYSANKQV
jgi:hypothetical protein